MNKVLIKASMLFAVLSIVFAGANATHNGLLVEITDPLPDVNPTKQVKVETILSSGLDAPIAGESPPGHDRVLAVADQSGKILLINLDDNSTQLFFDLNDERNLIEPRGFYSEQGLLGLAFDPAFQLNGYFYTHTSEFTDEGEQADHSTIPNGTDPNHQSLILKWHVADPSDLSSAISLASEVLRVDQPQSNHNAGALAFGLDSLLYIAWGDGGSASDFALGHTVPEGNAQDLSNIFGTIMRIDPHGTSSANEQYSVPAGNLSGGTTGGEDGCLLGDGICDETYAYGFRNPWKISFDSATGDLFVGDVGQSDIEEVSIVLAGGNYGWRVKEGSFCFHFLPPDNPGNERYVADPGECADESGGMIDPISEYDHDDGISVVGGYVYRGDNPKMAPLKNRYIFADYKGPTFQTLADGRLMFLSKQNVTVADYIAPQELRIRDDQPRVGTDDFAYLFGFAQDAAGEIYLLGKRNNEADRGNGNIFGPVGDRGFVKRLSQMKGR